VKPWQFKHGHKMATARGEDCGNAKITDDIVSEIRSAGRQRKMLRQHLRTQLTNKALASKFGITERQICRILSGDSWSESA